MSLIVGPRFDYVLSHSPLDEKHRPLPEPKWRLVRKNRPLTATWNPNGQTKDYYTQQREKIRHVSSCLQMFLYNLVSPDFLYMSQLDIAF